jgi:hypothetical protein
MFFSSKSLFSKHVVPHLAATTPVLPRRSPKIFMEQTVFAFDGLRLQDADGEDGEAQKTDTDFPNPSSSVHASSTPPSAAHGLYPTDPAQRRQRLREHLDVLKARHETEIMQLKTLKDAHIYCVLFHVSAQQYGPLLERFICATYGFRKTRARDCQGDCTTKDGKTMEIKVSLGGSSHRKFNYVQIRPAHDCDCYLFTAYHLSAENVERDGELYVFQLSKASMVEMLVQFGSYAHGTIKEHGPITLESIRESMESKSGVEYALRPTYGDACWNRLGDFLVAEEEI